MSLVLIEGYDNITNTQFSRKRPESTTTPGNTSVTGRFGVGLAARCNRWNNWFMDLASSGAEAIVGFGFKPNSNDSEGIMALAEGGTTHFWLWTNNGKVIAMNGARSVTYATSDYTLPLNGWVFLEVRVKVHDTLGEVEVRADGAVILSITGIDTRNGGTGVVNRAYFGVGPNGANNSGVAYAYDDTYAVIVDGVEPQDFLGDVRVDTLMPNGAGSQTDFTPLAGANYQNVDEATADDDTTYNSGDTAGQRDLFALDDHPVSAGSVYGLQVTGTLRKDDAGTRTAHLLVKSGATVAASGDIAVGTTYAMPRQIHQQNPDTTADWTLAEVNALEAGYEVVA